ncbi:hypothetical protein OsJ_32381 [Oryza sativa Japonica Group]|uniref:Uncharacterized protein n=1 Tax=Oryza sativa subsp. japonica TaxID=39947 RepID=B9G6W7_ORYSJ|nr:hypothetical protein OsJ_32381 [Oryza sativa Japonica Group]
MAATRDERPAPTQKWKPKKKAWARVEARASEAATLPVASSLSVFSSSRWTGRPAGWGGSQRGEAGEEEVQWPVAGDRRCGSRTGLPEDRASGGRWAKRVTGEGRSGRPTVGKRAAGEEGATAAGAREVRPHRQAAVDVDHLEGGERRRAGRGES